MRGFCFLRYGRSKNAFTEQGRNSMRLRLKRKLEEGARKVLETGEVAEKGEGAWVGGRDQAGSLFECLVRRMREY